MNKTVVWILFWALIGLSSCKKESQTNNNVRQVVDSIGFAKYGWQMDSIMSRLDIAHLKDAYSWKLVISPHDDYTYVGDLYPRVLSGLKAKTIIIFGVAHKARNFNLENKVIFESFNTWSAPYGKVNVSNLRDILISQIPDSIYIIHPEMHSVEHSIEALIPFLQYFNHNVEIIPILIPYMSFEKINQISLQFAQALGNVMKKNKLEWGRDIAILVSNDAVHYGDEDWGGNNYAPFGADTSGLISAKKHEMEIITNCLAGELNIEKMKAFTDYTVQPNDYKEYKWTWCGRYAIPFGLLTAYYLNEQFSGPKLTGTFIGYSNSIDHAPLKVDDLGMGTTAPANIHHWVGYAAVGYE